MTKESDGPIGGNGRGTRKRVLIAAGGVAVCVVSAVALYFSGGSSGWSTHKKSGSSITQSSSELGQPVFIETPEIVTNLDAGPHRVSFVKVQCKIEIARQADVSLMNGSMPRIVDLIQTYLRETRPEELRSDSGTYRLREALLSRATVASPDVAVKGIFFEELIVQ